MRAKQITGFIQCQSVSIESADVVRAETLSEKRRNCKAASKIEAQPKVPIELFVIKKHIRSLLRSSSSYGLTRKITENGRWHRCRRKAYHMIKRLWNVEQESLDA